jgi:perosamine synthetase
MIPYGRQTLDEADIQAVIEALRHDFLTGGPQIPAFEAELAACCAVTEAVVMSSGTAALHAACALLDLQPGDEVIVPAMTFAATANAVLYCGGTPVFADIQPQTLLLDPAAVAERIGPKTRAIIAVDYGGQPCDYNALDDLAKGHGLVFIADACHSLGASYQGRPVGSLADISCLSFHPVKPITTGEGGALLTQNPAWAERARRFRNHGLDSDFARRTQQGRWNYEMLELGYNYRLTDIQAALGRSQLRKLPDFIRQRQASSHYYDARLAEVPGIRPLMVEPDRSSGRHLYAVRLAHRDHAFARLREQGIGVNVHYRPVYLHPYYQAQFGHRPGLCPRAEAAFAELLSLPLYVGLTRDEQDQVILALKGLSPC